MSNLELSDNDIAQLTTNREKFIRDLLDSERVQNEWLGLGNTEKIKTGDPFNLTTYEIMGDPSKRIMELMMDPKFFYFSCKHLLGMTLSPLQLVCIRELWNRPFPLLIGSRGFSKTTMLAVYSMLKAILNQGEKVVVCGAGLRQSRLVFEYCLRMWENSDLLRDLFLSHSRDNGPKTLVDKLMFNLGESTITFIPIGDGSKIRGLRASTLISDEFAALNPEVFEVVVQGFTSVSLSPIESMKYKGRMKAMKALGIPIVDGSLQSNQSIISGTCYYTFNHFYAYWQKWKAIIESRGNINKLEDIFQGDVPKGFSWKDYSIIRIPVEMIGEGFMDEKAISKAKASLNKSQFLMEYSSVWPNDSMGFFKRTLIESCVARDNDPVDLDGQKITFNAKLRGNRNLEYVYGVDPASEKDNFSIVILEMHENHRRIVYCWTTQRSDYKNRLRNKKTEQGDFYHYCSRKIRDLMKVFPCKRIIMDAMGGGYAVTEALSNKTILEDGELPIFEIIDENKEKPTDMETGLHILELAQFVRAEWVNVANNGMKMDFENKQLLFPDYDASLLTAAEFEDDFRNIEQDTLATCIDEIELLKEELTTIVHTQTGTQGRDRWDTPEIKLEGNKKGRLRKDRYSALLMANMAARVLQGPTWNATVEFCGGVAQNMGKREKTGQMYLTAPEWFGKNTDAGGKCIRRNGV